MTLRAISRLPDCPGHSAIYRWIEDFPVFREQYYRSMEIGIHAMVDETLEIAKDGTGDTWINEHGEEVTNSDVLGRSKLRIDTMKWYAAMKAPKHYSPKAQVEHTSDPNRPILVRQEVAIDNKSLAEVSRILLELSQAAEEETLT